MGNYTFYGKVRVLVGTEEGGVRQHRKRLGDELSVNLEPKPLGAAVALFKKKFSSIQEVE